MKPDLFPETLLVNINDGHTFTTSLKVAEHFHKQHFHVLRDIEKVIADAAELGISLSNFGLSDSKNSRGKIRPMYTLDRKAFAILAGRFTGKQALRWQIDFYDAFDAMEQQLLARVEREAAALHQLRPYWKVIAQNTEAGKSRAEICHLTGHRSKDTISRNRRQLYNAGLLSH